MFRNRIALLALVLASGLPASASALPLVSEVFYDAVGSDDGQTFVELYATPGMDLTGLVIEGINGSNGAVTVSFALSGIVPDDGFFVVADDRGDGSSDIANVDLVLNFDFQNGPDSIVLRRDVGVIDAVGYGVFGLAEVFAGEGSAAPDPPAGSSLARLFADVDTDDNAADFAALTDPTPGSGALLIPEPASAALLGAGLLGLVVMGRRP